MTLGSQDIQALKDRGVTNPDEFASLDAAVLNDELRRFDSESMVGAGALVHRLRQAKAKPKPSSILNREADYGRGIVEWLQQNLPELCDPKGGPHPAAISMVIRLDWRDGKQSRSKRGWGREVRAAVVEFDRKFGDAAAVIGAR